MPTIRPAQWDELWQSLAVLQDRARQLRRLSQQEPLAQRRPDYPRAGTSRSHEGEVRALLGEILTRLEEVRTLLPTGLAGDPPSPGLAGDEHPRAVAARLDPIIRLVAGLKEQAFQPAPELPPHAPPYLVEPPGHDLAGTKAVVLALGIEGLVMSIRNAMLAAVNDA